MSGTEEVDDIRLPGRVPRSGTGPRRTGPEFDDVGREGGDGDIETVNRLLGFLRDADEA